MEGSELMFLFYYDGLSTGCESSASELRLCYCSLGLIWPTASQPPCNPTPTLTPLSRYEMWSSTCFWNSSRQGLGGGEQMSGVDKQLRGGHTHWIISMAQNFFRQPLNFRALILIRQEHSCCLHNLTAVCSYQLQHQAAVGHTQSTATHRTRSAVSNYDEPILCSFPVKLFLLTPSVLSEWTNLTLLLYQRWL